MSMHTVEDRLHDWTTLCLLLCIQAKSLFYQTELGTIENLEIRNKKKKKSLFIHVEWRPRNAVPLACEGVATK